MSASRRADISASPASEKQGHNFAPAHTPDNAPQIAQQPDSGAAWSDELALRMEAYRSRKRRRAPNAAQPLLPFEYSAADDRPLRVALEEAPAHPPGDFSFTIAIGRTAERREKASGRMEIDVSAPPVQRTENPTADQADRTETYGAYPVASLEERRFAAAVDFACLLFAYGAFLALFGSLGGQFTLSKLTAAVYAVTFGIVYLQYFALFTVFGGTTPGMMFRGLQVTSFTGDLPTPRQMLLRSAGYILSAGTFFLGFFWAWWDEDALTWHDRLSHTYLGVVPIHEEMESPGMAPSHSR